MNKVTKRKALEADLKGFSKQSKRDNNGNQTYRSEERTRRPTPYKRTKVVIHEQD